MIGIIVQLALSYLLVWLFEKGNLQFLGLTPPGKRFGVAALFLLMGAVCCASGFLLRIYFAGESWQLNPSFDGPMLWKGIWWNLKSVFFEELIFRGVLLYILIKKLGAMKAMVISSVAFGIYHWFSFEVFGNPGQMIVVFLTTGLMGFVYAFAYVRTGSILTPAAIHFGWNFTQGFIFSSGPTGNGLFVLLNQPVVTVSWFAYLMIMYFPMLTAIVLNLILLRRWNVDWSSGRSR
jgi:membrane protease YdiL (CAAX protease family)